MNEENAKVPVNEVGYDEKKAYEMMQEKRAAQAQMACAMEVSNNFPMLIHYCDASYGSFILVNNASQIMSMRAFEIIERRFIR
jgi:hypothetical protein